MTHIPNWIYEKTKIFHITHIDNLENILKSSGIYAKNHLPCNVKSIANEDVQEKRTAVLIPNLLKHNLHDYVPFYFAPRSPMLYVNSIGGILNAEPQAEIIYIVTYVQKITGHLPFIFSDRHPVVKIAQWYTDLCDLHKIKWDRFFQNPLMGEYAKYWKGTAEWPDRSEIRQAEFLVYKKLPWEFVRGLATMNTVVKDQVEAILKKFNLETTVIVKPEWYY